MQEHARGKEEHIMLGREIIPEAAIHGIRRMELTAVLTPAEEGGFVAYNPETGTTTQGESVEEALANLREATELFLSEFPLTTAGHPWVTTFTVADPKHA
jgi:predicted RNase H-like HicB family nuclease